MNTIGAFIEIVSMGRETTLVYDNRQFGVIHNNGFVELTSNEYQIFDDAWSLVVKGKICGNYFVNCWNDISIKIMY